jgi:hypothetical protein
MMHPPLPDAPVAGRVLAIGAFVGSVLCAAWVIGQASSTAVRVVASLTLMWLMPGAVLISTLRWLVARKMIDAVRSAQWSRNLPAIPIGIGASTSGIALVGDHGHSTRVGPGGAALAIAVAVLYVGTVSMAQFALWRWLLKKMGPTELR